jgi:restriction endonuclease S subunit
MEIKLPSLAKQREILNQLDEVGQNIEQIRIASKRSDEVLKSLSTSVLKQAFTGNLVDLKSNEGPIIQDGGEEQKSLDEF